VLIVEDVAMCRKIHKKYLTPFCAEIAEATNGQEAVNYVEAAMRCGQVIDGILMDSSMPYMNGTTATRLIRDMGYKGKIFGVTGNAYKVMHVTWM
jgi:CheY-like chemotaxis protein